MHKLSQTEQWRLMHLIGDEQSGGTWQLKSEYSGMSPVEIADALNAKTQEIEFVPTWEVRKSLAAKMPMIKAHAREAATMTVTELAASATHQACDILLDALDQFETIDPRLTDVQTVAALLVSGSVLTQTESDAVLSLHLNRQSLAEANGIRPILEGDNEYGATYITDALEAMGLV